MSDTLKQIETMIQQAVSSRMWGSVELIFNDGDLAAIKKTETQKILSRKGTNYDGNASRK